MYSDHNVTRYSFDVVDCDHLRRFVVFVVLVVWKHTKNIQQDNGCLTALGQRYLHRKIQFLVGGIVSLYNNLPRLHSYMSIRLYSFDQCLFYHLKY